MAATPNDRTPFRSRRPCRPSSPSDSPSSRRTRRWSVTGFTTASRSRWLYSTVEATLLTLLAVTVVVTVLGSIAGDSGLSNAFALGAWALVPAILGRTAFLLGAYGTANATVALVAAGVLGVAACLWVGDCWREGYQHAFDLRPAVSTLIAGVSVLVCVLLVFVPFFL